MIVHDVQVETIVEGEFDVTVNGADTLRVFLPPGLGVAGYDDELFVLYAVRELLQQGGPLPAVLDLAEVVGRTPWLIAVVADALDAADTDTV